MRQVFAAGLLSCSAPALADVTLQYGPVGNSNQLVTIEADAAGNVRSEAGPGQVMLMRADGQAYLAVPGDEEEFVRLDDYVAVLDAHRRAHPNPRIQPPRPAHYVLEPRGEEQVGQWRGLRFVLAPAGPHDAMLDHEVVISTDPVLAEAARAAARFFTTQGRMASAAFGPDSPEHARLAADMYSRGLPLRVSIIYRLESIGNAPIPAARFAIPAPLLSREELAERLH